MVVLIIYPSLFSPFMPEKLRRKRLAEACRKYHGREQEQPTRRSARLEGMAQRARDARAAEDKVQREARLQEKAQRARDARAAEDEAQRAIRLQ